MEELTMRLKDYGRFLELEDSVPYWEAQLPESKARIRELTLNRDRKQFDLNALQDPNFFQRILGRTEEKKEKLNAQLREVTAALTAAQWEQKELEKGIAAGKQEMEALSNSREAYEKAKEAVSLTPAQESQLMMQEIAAFTPVALAAADRIIEALEDARFWMQEDAISRGVRPENRKLDFLSRAEENANRLRQILTIMPEGCGTIGSYLRDPDGYIVGVTSEFGQLDRLNNAISQVQETRNQLRMLQ